MSFLALYRDPVIAEVTRRSEWRIADLVDARQPVSLYLVIPPSDISRTKPLIRLMLNQFGKRLFNIFFKTYTEKVWGMSCKEISADWAAQRVKNLSLSSAIVNAVLPKRNQKAITSLIEEFEAVDWYRQRADDCDDPALKEILR